MAVLLVSCSTPKDVAYLQNAKMLDGRMAPQPQVLRLMPSDKINIVVSSSDAALESQFTLVSSSQASFANPVSSTSMGGSGVTVAYTVDEQGDINFPVLGKISVKGKTRGEVADYIAKRLVARELVSDPIVTVEYVNMSVDVLGEVNKPGRKTITKDCYTIINAISDAGDLGINGERSNVLVTRVVDGEIKVYTLDLCDMESLITSEAYWLRQNDVVYVSPNNMRKRSSKSAGNTYNQPGFWLSLTSLLVTIANFVNSR